MKYCLFTGDVLACFKKIEDSSVDLIVTSPPYWGLRDYGVEGQMGGEPSMEAYLKKSLEIVKEAFRVLKPSGSLVWNLGDCFIGGGRNAGNSIKGLDSNLKGEDNAALQPEKSVLSRENLKKSLNGRIYKEKQFLSVSSFFYCKVVSETDFVCRGEHIWCKPNVPSPIRCRLKSSHEKLFWFVKDVDKYFFDAKPWLKENKESTVSRMKYRCNKPLHPQGMRNGRTIEAADYSKQQTIEHSWRVVPVGEKQKGFELCGKQVQEHVAPFPEALTKPYIGSLCPKNGIVLDPFSGSGTVMKIAKDLHLNAIGFDLNETYLDYSKKRLNWNNGVDGHEYCEVNLLWLTCV